MRSGLTIWGIFLLAMLFLAIVSWRPALPQNSVTTIPIKPDGGVSFVPKTTHTTPPPRPTPLPPQPKRQFYILPPVEFDHHYEGDLTIMMVNDLGELKAACGIHDQPLILACAFPRSKACLIILVRDEIMRQRGWNTGLLLRHEIGHCNGWVAHEGQRAITWPTTYWAQEYERPVARGARNR
jgi:hypothetical protein